MVTTPALEMRELKLKKEIYFFGIFLTSIESYMKRAFNKVKQDLKVYKVQY